MLLIFTTKVKTSRNIFKEFKLFAQLAKSHLGYIFERFKQKTLVD